MANALGSLVVKVALDYAEANLGLDRLGQDALKMADQVERGVGRAVRSFQKGGTDSARANAILSESMGKVAANVSVLAESEAQASARIRDMVQRLRQAQQSFSAQGEAMQRYAASTRTAARGARDIATTVAVANAAMAGARATGAGVEQAFAALQETLARTSGGFASTGVYYAKLDALMGSGKLSMQDYESALAAVGQAEERQAQAASVLMSRYDPLGMASKKLAADEKHLAQAHAAGAITTEQYQRALSAIDTQRATLELRRLDAEETRLTRDFKKGQISARDYQAALAAIRGNRSALRGIADGATRASDGMHRLGLHTVAARRELLLLGREALMGQWSSLGGSAMVLAERMDLLSVAARPATLMLGVVAGGAAAVGLAAYEASAEQSRLATAIVQTGQIAGGTVGGFISMADRLGEVNHNAAQVREVLTGLIAAGQIGGDAIEVVARAASNTARLTGESAEQVVAQFNRMGDGVVQFADEYDKRFHALSMATYEHITALEKHGQTEEAQRVLAGAIAQETQRRLDDLHGNLNVIQRGWESIKTAASSAWRVMKDAASSSLDMLTPEQELHSRLDWRDGKLTAETFGTSWISAYKGIDNEARIAELQATIAQREAEAQADARTRRIDAEGKAAFKSLSALEESSLNRANALRGALEKVRRQWEALHKADPGLDKLRRADPRNALLDPAALDKLLAAEKRKWAGTRAATTSSRADTGAGMNRLQTRLRQEENALRTHFDHLTALRDQGQVSEESYLDQRYQSRDAALQRERAIAEEMEAMAAGKKQQALHARYADEVARIDREIERNKQAHADALATHWAKIERASHEASANTIRSINGQISTLQDQIAQYGQLPSAIEATTAARLEEKRAVEASFGATDRQLADIDAEIDARRRLAGQLRQREAFDVSKKAAERSREEWRRAASSIETTIGDSLMRGFDKGQGFAKTLVNSLKSMFKTLVLRPIVAPIASAMASLFYPGAAGAMGISGMGGAAEGAAGSGLASLPSYIGILSKLANGIPSMLAAPAANALGGDVLGSYLTITGQAGPAAGLFGTGVGALGFGSAALGGNLGAGLLFGNKGHASIGGSLGAMGGLALGASSAVAGTALGATLGSAAGPLGAIAGTVVGGLLGSLFGGRHGPKISALATFDQYGQTGYRKDPRGGDPLKLNETMSKVFHSLSDAAKALGGAVREGTQLRFGYEADPTGGARGFVSHDILQGRRVVAGNRKEVSGQDMKQLQAELSTSVKRALLSGLQQSDLPAAIAGIFGKLDANKLSGDEIDRVLAQAQAMRSLFQAIGQLGDTFENLKRISTDAQLSVLKLAGGVDAFNAQAGYFQQHFTSASDQAAQQAKAVNQALADLGYAGIHTRAQFRELVQGLDLSTASGQQAYVKLLALSSAFDAVATSAEASIQKAFNAQSSALTSFKGQLDEFRQSLRTGDWPTLSPEDRYQQTKRTYEDVLNRSQAGDAAAQSKLSAAASDFLNASKGYFASSTQFQADLASVTGAMDKMSTSADQQLNQLKKMVDGILDIDAHIVDLPAVIAAHRSGRPVGDRVNGSHAGGLRRVPFDGYIAELHRDERVLTAGEAKRFDAASINLTGYGTTTVVPLIAEIKALRASNERLEAWVQAGNTDQRAIAAQRAAIARQHAQQMTEQTEAIKTKRRPGQ
ncbi:MAG: phage tail length tape measure family protein [Janthinobacterium lividum]